ncbi:MAG: hypothetical protein HY958_00905 [Bacteroidia bacterium]|nr:hypothetical protein [Bacteroidia bacterium]
MKKFVSGFLFISIAAGLASCGTDVDYVYLNNTTGYDTDVTNFKKDNSIEVVMHTKRLNAKYDLLTTVQKVYVDSNMVKEIIRQDTLPRLSKKGIFSRIIVPFLNMTETVL